MNQPRPADHVLGAAARSFLRDLAVVLSATISTLLDGTQIPLEDGLKGGMATIRRSCDGGGKAILIGNGGSAAIASHLATDMWKNGKLEAVTFNDPSLLTCLSNDCGYEDAFAIALERFARPIDTLVAISSSGRSPNILNGVSRARAIGCKVVTFSGFDTDNPLRQSGDFNLYLGSHIYGIVEAGHLALLHSMLDAHMGYPVEGSDHYSQTATPTGLATPDLTPSI